MTVGAPRAPCGALVLTGRVCVWAPIQGHLKHSNDLDIWPQWLSSTWAPVQPLGMNFWWGEERNIKHSADSTIHRISRNAKVHCASCKDIIKKPLEVLHWCQNQNLGKNIQVCAVVEVIWYSSGTADHFYNCSLDQQRQLNSMIFFF